MDVTSASDSSSAFTMDELTERLMASRYGELACLRALSIVEKQQSTVEELIAQRGNPPPVPTAERLELSSVVSTARRVSGMTNALRARLEQALTRNSGNAQTQPMTAASNHGRNAVVRRSDVPADSAVLSPADARSLLPPLPARPQPRRRRSFPRPIASNEDATPQQVPVAPPVMPPRTMSAPSPESTLPSADEPIQVGWRGGGGASDVREATELEVHELAAGGRVGRMLRDEGFRARIERVLLSRVRDPEAASARARGVREAINRFVSSRAAAEPEQATAQHDREARAPPTAAEALALPGGRPPPTPLTGNPALDNLALVTGASFELLLSIQRTLQQDLSSALLAAQQRPAPPEGAAALPPAPATADAATIGTVGAATPMSFGVRGDPQRSHRLGACVVCTEAEVSTVFYRCGHMCCCTRCAFALRQRRSQCPICRAPVVDVIQAFLACAPPPIAEASPPIAEAPASQAPPLTADASASEASEAWEALEESLSWSSGTEES